MVSLDAFLTDNVLIAQMAPSVENILGLIDPKNLRANCDMTEIFNSCIADSLRKACMLTAATAAGFFQQCWQLTELISKPKIIKKECLTT